MKLFYLALRAIGTAVILMSVVIWFSTILPKYLSTENDPVVHIYMAIATAALIILLVKVLSFVWESYSRYRRRSGG